ncbi:MAG TPA: hypothetical protein VMU34_19780 [Mycobacterium sp.]|nr:hypothetical protein [Mycobacterium sp.]
MLDAADAVLDAADAVLRCARAAPTNFTQTMLAPAHGEIRLPRGGSQG